MRSLCTFDPRPTPGLKPSSPASSNPFRARRHHERSTHDALDYYDAWYDENNLQELLRERMALKDRKKGGASAGTSRRPSTGEL
jgi:hypothetical protein